MVRLTLCSLACALALSTQALASTITVYNNASAFAAAVGSTTLIDFEAQNSNGDSGYESYGSLLTVGDVSISQPDFKLFVLGQDVYNTPGLSSDYLNQNGGISGMTTVSFAEAVYGVGMGLGYIPFRSFSNSITFTLSTGDVMSTTIPRVDAAGGGSPLLFFGFTSDVPIVSFDVYAPSAGMVIDDFRYAKALATVPDATSTLPLLTVGMASLVAARKRLCR
jgi:hypothetical protein